jgi:glucose-6-phosphate isomerase
MATKYPKKSDPRILVVDVGGTHVKLLVTGLKQPIKIPSGHALTAKATAQKVNQVLADRPYDAVSNRIGLGRSIELVLRVGQDG